MKNLLRRLFPEKPAAEPATYRIRFDGVTCGRLDDREDGLQIKVCLFRSHFRPNVGDYFIVTTTSGQESRYKLTGHRNPFDPGDQHFLDLSFAPRAQTSTEGGQENSP